MTPPDLMIIGLVSLVGGLFGGLFIGMIRDDILFTFFAIGFGVLIFSLCMYYAGIEQEKILEYELELENQKIEQFKTLDCSSQGDYILKQYVGGNQTFTEKLIPEFEKAGCKFTIAELEIIR